MKKSMKIGLVAAMLALSTIVAVFGTELPVNVVASGEKSVNLYFGEIKGKVWITVYDKEGIVLHSKTLRDIESYGIQYDLSNLPNGTYVLGLEREDQTKQVQLEIRQGKVTVFNNYTAKPAVKVSKNLVTVDMEQATDAVWNISIADLDHNLIFKGTMEGTTSRRTYDLSNLPRGEYLFELKANGNSFTEHIALKK